MDNSECQANDFWQNDFWMNVVDWKSLIFEKVNSNLLLDLSGLNCGHKNALPQCLLKRSSNGPKLCLKTGLFNIKKIGNPNSRFLRMPPILGILIFLTWVRIEPGSSGFKSLINPQRLDGKELKNYRIKGKLNYSFGDVTLVVLIF